MAADLVLARGWLDDPGGQKSWEQIQSASFQPYDGVLSRGFGSSALWIKLSLTPHGQGEVSFSDGLLLRLRPVYLDDIQVYDQGRLVAHTGDRHHPAQQALRGLDFLVPLSAGPLPRDIWLRVQSTSTRQIFAEVVPARTFLQETPLQHLMFSMYVALVLIFALWGLTYWVFTGEKMMGLFGTKQGAALLYALCSLGFARMWWPQDWATDTLDHLASVFSMLATSLAIYFHSVFLSDYQPRRWISWALKGVVGLLPINLLLFFVFNKPSLALQINMLTVLLAPFLLLLAAWTAQGWRRAQPPGKILLPRFLIVGFYAVLIAILVLAALPGLGMASGSEIGLYLVQAHGLASGLIVLLLLHYRAYLVLQAQFAIRTELQRVQLEAERDREQRQEQEKLLAMLTHELKTPLSTMYMRLDERSPEAGALKKSIREMNGVIDRCVQVNRLEDKKMQPNRVRVDVSHLVREAVAVSPDPQRFELQVPHALCVNSDLQLLFMVLGNLFDNACKYSDPATPIVVSLQEEGARIQLSVSNQPGRAGRPEASSVFDKYYRSAGAQGQAGTGLGLFLAHSLVATLGGNLAYQPTPTHVLFVLRLPKD